ncbi:elongation factor G [Rhodobacter ferrooxidans]|uniref:Elongation factor G n=1 Tax=Rhodobacter ferrooxidans TaxID=371731 RepID=C8S3W6_9RHOB|nr:elongation factor G [Rhodobacter sp. SW2]EEW24335.1 elongation factor G domain IV [Rhodobacter sp. SW2]
MSNTVSGPRCAALVGTYTSGKTTLFEDLLFAVGAVDRRGTVREGNTVGDGATEARARAMSTELSVASIDFMGEPWALIDCPGSVELAYEAKCAMMVADVVVVVCEPVPERAVALSPILKFVDDHKIPHLLYINKMDQAEASVRATFEALQTVSSRPLVLREIPLRDETGKITGLIDLVSERAWRWNPHKPSDLISLPERLKQDESTSRSKMLESLADFDDTLMGELLEDTVPSTDEIYANLVRDLQQDLIVPVFFGSAEQENGITRLWKALRHEAPGVAVTAQRLGIDPAGGTQAQVFKTVYAGQSGKMSLARVWAGDLRDGMPLGNDRLGSIGSPLGKKITARKTAVAGEVVVLGRMATAATGELLGEHGVLAAKWPVPPAPHFAHAIRAERQSDEVKLAAALARLSEEDPSLTSSLDAGSGELVLGGQGEMQLQIAISRLKGDYGLQVSHHAPSLPYKETITRPASQHSRHKKQSGGHGEFADVHLEITPLPRGEGIRFDDRITGGVVPRQYIPAVEKGVMAYLARGPLGFEVVDVAVSLTDGGFHAVDSSDMAFQKAAAKAMTEAMANCGPVLLEPIVRVTVSVPTEFTPKVQRIVNSRRGQLLGYDAKDGWQGWDEVQAVMPQSETADLIIDLRSQSLGVGFFETVFDHLREVEGREAEKVIAARAEALK